MQQCADIVHTWHLNASETLPTLHAPNAASHTIYAAIFTVAQYAELCVRVEHEYVMPGWL